MYSSNRLSVIRNFTSHMPTLVCPWQDRGLSVYTSNCNCGRMPTLPEDDHTDFGWRISIWKSNPVKAVLNYDYPITSLKRNEWHSFNATFHWWLPMIFFRICLNLCIIERRICVKHWSSAPSDSFLTVPGGTPIRSQDSRSRTRMKQWSSVSFIVFMSSQSCTAELLLTQPVFDDIKLLIERVKLKHISLVSW